LFSPATKVFMLFLSEAFKCLINDMISVTHQHPYPLYKRL
jgi:hypothetical protein